MKVKIQTTCISSHHRRTFFTSLRNWSVYLELKTGKSDKSGDGIEPEGKRWTHETPMWKTTD